MIDKPMKSPDEVRAELNAARESFKTRHQMYQAWGVTSGPSSMQDWNLQRAADDDALWAAILEEYVRDYTSMLARDAEFRAETQRWRERSG